MTLLSVPETVYAFVCEASGLVYFECDSHGCILFANDTARRMTQRDFEKQDVHFHDVLVDFNGYFQFEGMLEHSGKPHLLHFSVPGGSPQSYRVRFFPADGRVCVIGEADTAELAFLQQELLSSTTELATTTRKLQKANAELTKLNDLKNHFIGMAAHDLRNPIGGILAYGMFLQEEADVLSSEQIEFLEIITSSSRYMLGLIDDLLDFVRIESGRLSLESSRSILSSSSNIMSNSIRLLPLRNRSS
ncbi:histidine kinase dimerization/phospho-acceptor domain-containing protein [Desulfovibrio inopinatus]|uniref:histidine kinase dimerization/phospho-acceptor domain-containing protein n=1 Tax=Desulfovibrio inopinatus TaxID=102109 RepID=UPI0004038B1A|nr:histidine kinase dimerization/phospho-acceptor domain-containing protein [Desulfovibrio inopinatus]